MAKVTHQVNPQNLLSVRYGYNTNDQPYGASPLSPPENWGVSKNKFHSANLNLNSAIGGGKLNEFVFQFSYFDNHIAENSNLPYEIYPNRVAVGQSINTPQSTKQQKYQFRDDFSWIAGKHELKAGVSFIYEPTLDITFSTGQSPLYRHLTDSRTSAISEISFNGAIGGSGGLNVAALPNEQYGFYLQDGWRVTNKLNLDLGLRYDLVTGFAIDQSQNVIFSELQAAAAAGVFGRSGLPCPCPGFEDFGKSSEEDKNNFAPRVGFTYDTKADGTLILRGGAGRYYDYGYTNANILFAAVGAQSSFGQVYLNTNTSGVRNADGSLYQVGQPLPPNQLTNVTRPLPSQAASPRIKQPYTDQANVGFSKKIGRSYAFEVDAVYAKGNDLGLRPRLNVRIDGGNRRFLSFLPRSGNSNFRVDISEGVSHYKGINIGFKKRQEGKLGFGVWYSLSEASTSASLRATDEFGEYDVLSAFDPFQDNQENPTRTDARHRFTLNAVWQPGAGFTVAPIFRYRSKTAYNVISGVDGNRDGLVWDLPAGVETLNSARGADFSQFDLRVSKDFRFGRKAQVQLIAEVFNILNDTNPNVFVENMASATFGTPTRYAGDFRQGEQRLAQFGLRLQF